MLIWNIQVKRREFERLQPEPYGLTLEELGIRERQYRKDIRDTIAKALFKPVDGRDGDEVVFTEFLLSDGRTIHYERYQAVDLEANKPLAGSQLKRRQKVALVQLEKELQLEFKDKNERNEFLATKSGLLRAIPSDFIYMAGDKDDKVLVYLDPIGIPYAFGQTVQTQMERDSIRFYSLKNPVYPKGSKDVRHISQERHMQRNGFVQDQCGVDHICINVRLTAKHSPSEHCRTNASMVASFRKSHWDNRPTQ